MGMCVRNVRMAGKVMSFDGLHGHTFNVHFDDLNDELRQGNRRGTAPALSGTATINQGTGVGSFDTTALGFVTGSTHLVRFVHPQNGHVTPNFPFVAG